MGFLFHFFCCIIDIHFEKTHYFDLIILTMKFIALQFLGVAMLMMLYTFAAPLSEERQGGEENEMQREGAEMQRGRLNLDGNEPGDEEDRDCPCWKCWNMCSNFEPEEERRRLTDEMQNEEGEEERRGQTNEMQREGVEMQRGGGGGGEGGKQMLKRDGGGTGFGCDLENHLQGGGWIQLLGEC